MKKNWVATSKNRCYKVRLFGYTPIVYIHLITNRERKVDKCTYETGFWLTRPIAASLGSQTGNTFFVSDAEKRNASG